MLNQLRNDINKGKKDVDERRFILLKSQITNLTAKNNALLEINKKQRKGLLEALNCMKSAEEFLADTESEYMNLLKSNTNKINSERLDSFTSKMDSGQMKFSKSMKAIQKRLENMLKEQRRNYTLSNFANNPYYDTDDFSTGNRDEIEEEEKNITIKFDKKMIWNLENKLTNILKRSLDIYKENIIDKNPFEKIKVLKFSELLRDAVSDMITLGVGLRDKE